jgi:hypothetical protein
MLSLPAYGKAIAYAEGNEGSTFWSEDKKTFYLKGQVIKLRRAQQQGHIDCPESQHPFYDDV